MSVLRTYYVTVGRKAGSGRIEADVQVHDARKADGWSSLIQDDGYITKTNYVFETRALNKEDAKNLVILHLLGDAPMIHRLYDRKASERTVPMTVPMIFNERRMIIKGWKIDGFRVAQGHPREPSWFTSYRLDPSDSSIEIERARIGADVPSDWQPHITEVIVEEREVTEWRPVVEKERKNP